MAKISMQTAEEFLSVPRLQPYVAAMGVAGEDAVLALYQWAVELEGAFHATLCVVEISSRNAIDRELRSWNSLPNSSGDTFTEEWTELGNTREALKTLLGPSIGTARHHAQREIERKSPRNGQREPTHDDIVAQLTFGNLSSLFCAPGHAEESEERENLRQTLWDECLKNVFPDRGQPVERRICSDFNGRQRIGRSLEALRRLRNRVAHHDCLLEVDIKKSVDSINSVLAKLDPELPRFAMEKSQLRRLRREDPRRLNSVEP
ncbi:Abi family protein [Corynebacterium pseudogenitalium]|uniref:Abi family protein n=1 Tax=Corynebacterium pseudogenitalium TaxID=38303 RepID=A0ABD4TS69_9CORY|nr:Abi family protein [Corynebacterium pseudogenitalium]MCQ4614687.1 Abi family protein [Corynebacterium pseudogenitalium]